MEQPSIRVGIIGQKMVETFSLPIAPDTPIFCGESNESHMLRKHHDDYMVYREHLREIISIPDFVGINPEDQSLEYYKDFNGTTVHVKVAVRPTRQGVYFVKTLYQLSATKLYNYLAAGRAKQVVY